MDPSPSSFPFLLFIFLLLLPFCSSFLFPSSGGSNCGCSPCIPPPSTCPTPAPCPQIMTCQAPAPVPVPTCCNSCGTCGKVSKRKRRNVEVLSNATYVADYESLRRVKRQEDRGSSKCNSEDLRLIIEKKIDRVTAIAKRRIQEEAEATMGGRFNVICARGDFSYVANTELFCQHTVGDVTCFLFKQLSDVVRKRLM